MAVTHGHGNPNWNRDETILALEASFALNGKNPSAKNPQIIALSQTLRALSYYGAAARKPTFCNPDGAAFKMQNLRSRETGKGLGNVSRMDRKIWDELGTNPAEVARLGTLIRAGIAADQQAATPEVDEADDVEFYEGRYSPRAICGANGVPVCARPFSRNGRGTPCVATSATRLIPASA